jgi:hypothetical protein
MTAKQQIDKSINEMHGIEQTVSKIVMSPEFYESFRGEYLEHLSKFGTYQQRSDKHIKRYRGCTIEIDNNISNFKTY